ncbi:thioesterase family protein [Nocardioides pacificus]
MHDEVPERRAKGEDRVSGVDAARTPTVFQVTADDCRHEADTEDPAVPGYGEHLPFHSILQRCGVAWRDYLGAFPSFNSGVIVPRVAADFLAEVHLGRMEIEVVPSEVWTSSFAVVCEVFQNGTVVARVRVVLVNFDYDSRTAVPLSGEQRKILQRELASSVARGVDVSKFLI